MDPGMEGAAGAADSRSQSSSAAALPRPVHGGTIGGTDDPVGAAARPRERTLPAPVLRSALAFAILGALLPLQPLLYQTYARLLSETGPLALQHPMAEGTPIPRAMLWDARTYNLIGIVGQLAPAAVLGIEVFLVLLLLYCLARILNPTFRITTGVDWDRTLLTKTYMHAWPVTKAFLILVAAIVPGFALWALLQWAIGDGRFSLWLRMAALGAGVWLLFSRNGVAGDYESGGYEPPRARHTIAELSVRGALAGTAVWAMFAFPPRYDAEALMNLYHSVGYIGQAQWQVIAGMVLGTAALLGLAGGGLAVALGDPYRSQSSRLSIGLPFAALLLVALLAGRMWLPDALDRRYDYAPGSRRSGADRLAALTSVAAMRPAPFTVWLLAGGRALPVRFDGKSAAGLPVHEASGVAIRGYLTRKDFRTALSYPAYVTLLDSAAAQWSDEEFLRACIDNLTHAPDPPYMAQLFAKLQNSAATPGVLALADRLTDDGQFEIDDRQAWVGLGDLFGKLGDASRAQGCYRRADLPAEQVALRSRQMTVFAAGEVRGRVLLDGKPAAGVRVGVLPGNGVDQLARLTDPTTHITPPYWLSWIRAAGTTDASGRFAIDHLQTDRYFLALQPPGAELAAVSPRGSASRGLTAISAPPYVVVGPIRPRVNIGDLSMSTR